MEPYVLPEHPCSLAEAQHLTQTHQTIQREIDKLEKDTGVGAEEERLVVVPADATMDEQVMMDILRMKVDTLHNLARSRRQAYFAHLDFTPEGGSPETHYLGRWGVHDSTTLDVVVADWRSPVANLYYSGQVGPMDYEAPDGLVRGDLSLKRMLTVEGDRLISLFDSGVVSQDAYLQGVLGSVSSDRLKEIVTTIQAEQNLVIRHPLRQNLIVQGVAGSGKTTIALHRIAWLLYAFRDTLRPEQMMILAPNPLFLSYISQVLPDLGVERVIQTTFAGLCQSWMGKRAPKIQLVSRLEDKLSGTSADRAAMGGVLRRKGSLEMKRSVEAFLQEYQAEILPGNGLRFGGHVLYTPEEVQDIFLKQLRPFPLAQRIDELKKYIKKRLLQVAEAMKAAMDKMAQDRLTQLLAQLPDGEERRARARKLLQSRDERLAEIDQRAKQYLKEFPTLFPDLSLLTVYRTYLTRCEAEAVQAATLPLLDKKRVQQEDLAALCSICKALYGLPGKPLRHIVMDECQDFSPYQLALLREHYPAATFTLVGDLMQGIHEDEGISDYQQWMGPVFGGEATLLQLVTSYRNTVEIMRLASRVAARHPVPGQQTARPVLRYGEEPAVSVFSTDKERYAALRQQVRAWQDEGYHTIALIEKTRSGAEHLYKLLKDDLPVRLMKEDDTDYHGGVLILPAAMVKGLEFDCVAVCNASGNEFGNDPFLCRMLYVMLTRPLHRLRVLATGEITPLLYEK
ncbi:MAG: hypothetical protein E7316_05285 [Clostridiales bacterium]|nr:hypothetical protein [Clostridiales bacterium]